MENVISDVAEEAGNFLLKYSKKNNLRVYEKNDGSIVTEADIECSSLIKRRLEPLGFPVVSEEHIPSKLLKNEYFLVDPIDGTKAFAQKEDVFGTLIAFISNKKPIIGATFFPKLDMFFFAKKGFGCTLNGKSNHSPQQDGKIVAYSSGFHLSPIGPKIINELGISETKQEGSFLKLCRIAKGEASFYYRTGITPEWDTGACQVILEESGCQLWSVQSMRPLTYENSNFENRDFIAFENSLERKIKKIF